MINLVLGFERQVLPLLFGYFSNQESRWTFFLTLKATKIPCFLTVDVVVIDSSKTEFESVS